MINKDADYIIRESLNGFLLSHAIYALDNAGVYSALVSPKGFSLTNQKSSEVIKTLLFILIDRGLVEQKSGSFFLSDLGVNVFEKRGFFTWALGGYKDFFNNLVNIIIENNLPVRDEALVAKGSGLIDVAFLHDQVEEIVMSFSPYYISDLGCGDATRLCDWAMNNPTITGLGIERSLPAVNLAREQIAKRGLEKKISILHQDCLAHLPVTISAGVDCVTCFFLLHDLLNSRAGNLESVLTTISSYYPNSKRLIFADTVKTQGFYNDSFPQPVFAREFELVHAIMNTPLYTLSEYKEMFRSDHYRLEDVVKVGVPNSYLFILCKKA